ncbi:bifunctional threonine ammonia-lyase/L-serine ammonia-lyase TdcB [Lacticaseibacillus paracasei]|uniref:bifunctional threonine ammonia-lyase/L-serine ammonia-lyase TdcB n=1 Tax=Lacticaseibacillus paracasei TaxID=1597 RepID=UPI002FE35E84
MMTATQTVSIKDVQEASHLIHEVGRVTPLIQSMFLSRTVTHGDVYLKMENMQLTGSFKFRGAYNKIRHLSDAEKARGVITASAGNHAQGVALTAHLLDIDATVVMPKTAPLAKQQATSGYGAKVVLAGDTFDESRAFMEQKAKEDGLTIVDPYNDPLVIAGQGSIGLEILDQLWDVDTVIVPVGGGGLITGIATVLKHFNPYIHIVGVQSENVHGMTASLQAGKLTRQCTGPTLADGTAVAMPGDITFGLAEELVDEMVLVSEEEIAEAMKDLLQRTKTVAEGAGALPTAALEAHKIAPQWLAGKKVVALVSGGNVDLERVADNIDHFFKSDPTGHFIG